MNEHHTPVLYEESISYLITDKSGVYFDGTIGFGGHAEGILKLLNDSAVLIGTDVDVNAFDHSKKKFSSDKRVKPYNFNFSQIDIIAKIESIPFFTGVFADLGVSSFQLDNPAAGFTFRSDSILDLRLDKSKTINAADVINSFSADDLADLIFQYGEEKNSRRIAKKIVERRASKRIESTIDLGRIIEDITSPRYLNKTLSRVFQALRIYVNDELGTLKLFLSKSVELLKTGGRIVILTYHSLEDRIVKEFFKYENISCICPKDLPDCNCEKQKRLKILTRKPVTPSASEIKLNKRARSAKLRAAERL